LILDGGKPKNPHIGVFDLYQFINAPLKAAFQVETQKGDLIIKNEIMV